MPADHLPGGLNEEQHPEDTPSTLADHDAELASLWKNVQQLSGRVRRMEKLFDTLNSRVWLRAIFRIDGWGPWHRIRQTPTWRPWHRWWRS